MLNYYKKANINKIHTQFINKNRNLKKLNLFKFAGEWFTIYSTKLLNFVGIEIHSEHMGRMIHF